MYKVYLINCDLIQTALDLVPHIRCRFSIPPDSNGKYELQVLFAEDCGGATQGLS